MQGITLTDVQKVKVDSIVTAYPAQMPAFTPRAAARFRRARETHGSDAAAERRDRAVLTTEQQTTFDRNVETIRQNMGRPRP